MSDEQREGKPKGSASRPRKSFTVQKRLEILQTVARGLTASAAAAANGIDQATVHKWMYAYPKEYAEMCTKAWRASMARFPEACAKALSIVIEKIDKLDPFSAAKVLNELLAAWERGQTINAALDGSASAAGPRTPSPLADAIRAIGDALRKSGGAA